MGYRGYCNHWHLDHVVGFGVDDVDHVEPQVSDVKVASLESEEPALRVCIVRHYVLQSHLLHQLPLLNIEEEEVRVPAALGDGDEMPLIILRETVRLGETLLALPD